jgi:hypothetical protein
VQVTTPSNERGGHGVEVRQEGQGAEPVRSSGPLSDPEFVAGLRPIPAGPIDPHNGSPAHDIEGITPQGSTIAIRLDGLDQLLLLAFLHTECDGCDEFWRGFTDGSGVAVPDAVSVVIVTKGPESVDVSAVAGVAAGVHRYPVVMSDRAWANYRVLGYPFFVLVDPSLRAVVGETVGFGWSDVTSMIRSGGH